MLVADNQQQATSITLGAQKTVEFSITQDASFFQMMSANLYSNQKLAFVREVLCNFWDAHIEAGTTDIPGAIMINEYNDLIIQDSGLGIPHDKIAEVYGTYGSSTKATNNAVTGGFGLGCKSPFAYTDSFRVISEHGGEKVIYNMSRSSVESGGKPGITQVTKPMPTTRTGLTVSLKLQEDDLEEIVTYIKYIVRHGEMLVDFTFKGYTERLPVLGMDDTPGTYNIDSDKWYARYMGRGTNLFVRYGAVVYPMLETPGTNKAITMLNRFIEMVGYGKMLIQAAPGTLALSPSRETLSSQKMTEDGVTELCMALVKRIEDDLIAAVPAAIDDAEKRLMRTNREQSTLSRRANIIEFVSPTPVRKYLASSLGSALFAKYAERLKRAEKLGFQRAHVFRSSKEATHKLHGMRFHYNNTTRLSKHTSERNRTPFQRLIHQFVVKPVSRLIYKNRDVLEVSRLGFSHRHYYDRKVYSKGVFNKVMEETTFDAIKFLMDQPVMFVTSRVKSLDRSIAKYPPLEDKRGGETLCWFYKVEPNTKNVKEICDLFTQAGFTVINLMDKHDWDPVAKEQKIAALTRAKTKKLIADGVQKPRPKNLLLSLDAVFDPKTNKQLLTGVDISEMDANSSDAVTCDKPLYFIPKDYVYRDGRIGKFTTINLMTAEERNRTVVIRTKTEQNMAIKRGAVDIDAAFARKLHDVVLSKQYSDYMTKFRQKGLPDLGIRSSDLALLRVLKVKLTGYDKLYHNPELEEYARVYSRRNHWDLYTYLDDVDLKDVDALCEKVRGLTLDPKALPFIGKVVAIANDPIVRRLGNGQEILHMMAKFPERKAALKSLVLSALKNGTKK